MTLTSQIWSLCCWGSSGPGRGNFFTESASQCLYSLPVYVVTNGHKLSGFKQHTFIILPFWRSKVWNGSHWAKVKVLAGPRPSGGSRGESFPCLCSFQRPSSSLAHGPFLHVQSQQWPFLSFSLCISLTSLFQLLQTLVITWGPPG